MPRPRNSANAYRRSLSATPSPDGSLARSDEVCRQAFVYLGGRREASRFLDRSDADLGDKPVNIAMTSGFGMLIVSSRMQRLASSIRAGARDALVLEDGA